MKTAYRIGRVEGKVRLGRMSSSERGRLTFGVGGRMPLDAETQDGMVQILDKQTRK